MNRSSCISSTPLPTSLAILRDLGCAEMSPSIAERELNRFADVLRVLVGLEEEAGAGVLVVIGS